MPDLGTRLRERSLASPVLVLTTAVLSLALVSLSGGANSYFLPLMYLPIILAVVRCNFEVVVGIGLLLSCYYLYMVHMNDRVVIISREDAVRSLTILLMSLIGAVYARRVDRERTRLLHTVAEQEALLEASQAVSSAGRVGQALDSALIVLRAMIPNIRTTAIFLREEGQGNLQLASLSGISPHEMDAGKLVAPAEKGAWNPEKSPYYLPDIRNRAGQFAAEAETDARSVACATLHSLDMPIGLVYISSATPNAFSPNHLRLLQALADRIGFPLQKLRIEENLRGLAFTDPMTELFNFRAFQTQLNEELRRAVRYERPLSLIIVDLDGFKQINDRYGHPAGDKLLEGVASILRANVRQTDLPARYGGEEFVVVCPETDHDEALVVAERIRKAVEAGRFRLVPDETSAITCSAGVATHAGSTPDAQALIQAADSALYRAKRSGKNRVISASDLTPLTHETA
jgi:diguanylate cyclase (GGDEF)-like protein